MEKLTEIRRFRCSQTMVGQLNSLPTKFVRDAISEKLERDLPEIIAEEKRKHELIKCPF